MKSKINNILLILLVGLVCHNAYLNYYLSKGFQNVDEQLESILYMANRARNEAANAATYAEEASDASWNAASEAFGNKCKVCP